MAITVEKLAQFRSYVSAIDDRMDDGLINEVETLRTVAKIFITVITRYDRDGGSKCHQGRGRIRRL